MAYALSRQAMDSPLQSNDEEEKGVAGESDGKYGEQCQVDQVDQDLKQGQAGENDQVCAGPRVGGPLA